jgi:hypothetical protein
MGRFCFEMIDCSLSVLKKVPQGGMYCQGIHSNALPITDTLSSG